MKNCGSIDAHSVLVPQSITSTDNLRFEYNATKSAVTIPFPYKYIDIKGVFLYPYCHPTYERGVNRIYNPISNL